ncbi:hypothetical protein L915_17707 [Phytophthora nicotianae]|uniref:RxLR effector protein n=3 Tax=Phytophthora nicotianae TaxID=4792 RepID=V9E8S6_PHYNI|nr:hypothetical protein F443_18187 [Phytophthora nicotianae P1569]ETK75725.1 hypothetical protein L915_17707 [Phytophthora nicotianae]ETM35625.1 hypothetical protein L914_17497 [Phytophthora nicotianae]ETO64216.1 hypothetical protein F444_18210 [Phytophthora nicotianae P1976]
MGSSNIVLLIATVVLLGLTGSAAKERRPTIISEDASPKLEYPPASIKQVASDAKPLLRYLKMAGKPEEEERAGINVSFLKNLQKKLPGSDALKSAAAAKAAAAQAKKAQAAAKKAQAAAEKAKMANMFKITSTRDDHLFLKFNEWKELGKTDLQVIDGVYSAMRSNGWTTKKAIQIGNQYRRWSSDFT